MQGSSPGISGSDLEISILGWLPGRGADWKGFWQVVREIRVRNFPDIQPARRNFSGNHHGFFQWEFSPQTAAACAKGQIPERIAAKIRVDFPNPGGSVETGIQSTASVLSQAFFLDWVFPEKSRETETAQSVVVVNAPAVREIVRRQGTKKPSGSSFKR